MRLTIGALDLVAKVVEDHGDIGFGGRRMLGVAVTSPEGEVDRFDFPAEDVTVLPKRRATT